MKKEHDELAAQKREINYNKDWHKKGFELLKNYEISNFNKVMDVGAGKGEFLFLLKKTNENLDLFGVDYSETNIDELKRSGFEAIKIDFDNFNVNDYKNFFNQFDLVVSFEVIEHIFDTDKYLEFCNKVLKDDGLFIISTPNTGSLQYKLFYLLRGYPYGENHHVRFFTKKKLQQYLFFNGFDILKFNNYFSFSSEVIKRGFGVSSDIFAKMISFILFSPLYILNRLKICNFSCCTNFVLIVKKSKHKTLGLEFVNFDKNFNSLDENSKNNWTKRIIKYYKNDKLGEHITFKKNIENIINKN